MKTILFTTIYLLLLTGIVNGQHINIGIKAGLNASTIIDENSTNYDPFFSYNAGLLGHIHMSSNFALQPEIVFSGQGKAYKVGELDNVLKLNYINVPLIIQYMYDNGFRLQAGPQLGLLVSANLNSGDIDSDVKANYESTDIGVTVGMSYVKPSTGFGIDIRYNHGLTNINASDASKSYNRGIQLGLFFLFQHRS